VIEMLAITDAGAPPEPPLRAVRCGRLSAVCAPAEPGEVTADALWRREALLERLMDDRDLLPVRFGTLVPDESAAQRALEERREELAASLDRVRGAVELAVRVQGDERDLRARARALRDVHEPLAALARDSAVKPARELLRAAYLVERDAVDGFVAAVQELQGAYAILCTGPWPPYSFT
jgi:Gas vesicle synthesis protein GvpL/GvpF